MGILQNLIAGRHAGMSYVGYGRSRKNFRLKKNMILWSNMIRASRSMTRNIAEGFGKYYYKENIRFCRISLASQFEVEDDLITAKECAYISQSEFNHGISLLHTSKRLTNGYIRYLKRRRLKLRRRKNDGLPSSARSSVFSHYVDEQLSCISLDSHEGRESASPKNPAMIL
jgi:four helix bundle protein